MLAVVGLALLFGLSARFDGSRVEETVGPGGIAAEHWTGRAEGEAVELVRLAAGGRTVEVLRLQGPAPVLRWRGAGDLVVCTGTAEILRHRPEAELADTTVAVHVAPVAADECAQ